MEGLRELTKLRVLNLSYNRISRIGHGKNKIAHFLLAKIREIETQLLQTCMIGSTRQVSAWTALIQIDRLFLFSCLSSGHTAVWGMGSGTVTVEMAVSS
jgi:hypothetical protein